MAVLTLLNINLGGFCWLEQLDPVPQEYVTRLWRGCQDGCVWLLHMLPRLQFFKWVHRQHVLFHHWIHQTPLQLFLQDEPRPQQTAVTGFCAHIPVCCRPPAIIPCRCAGRPRMRSRLPVSSSQVGSIISRKEDSVVYPSFFSSLSTSSLPLPRCKHTPGGTQAIRWRNVMWTRTGYGKWKNGKSRRGCLRGKLAQPGGRRFVVASVFCAFPAAVTCLPPLASPPPPSRLSPQPRPGCGSANRRCRSCFTDVCLHKKAETAKLLSALFDTFSSFQSESRQMTTLTGYSNINLPWFAGF